MTGLGVGVSLDSASDAALSSGHQPATASWASRAPESEWNAVGLLSPLRFYQVPECSWRPLLRLITHPVTQHIPEHLLGGQPSGGAAGSRQSPPPLWRFTSSTPCSEPRGAPSLPTLWVLPPVTVGPGCESVPVCCGRGHGPSTPPPTVPLATRLSPSQPC